MNSLLSYLNHLSAATLRPLPGDWQSVHAGALVNLYTPQLADTVTIRATSRGPWEALGTRTVRHACQIDFATAATPPGPLLPIGLFGALGLQVSTDVGPVADANLALLWLVNGGTGFPTTLGSIDPVWPAQFPRNAFAVTPEGDRQLHSATLVVLHLGTTGTRFDVQLGGLWVGPTFRPARGLKSLWTSDVIPGAETGEADSTVSRGGQAFFSTPPIRRRFAGQWATLSTQEAHGAGGSAAGDWQAIVVSTRGRPVVILPRLRPGPDMSAPPDAHTMLRLGVYGHLQPGGGLQAQNGATYGSRSFTIDELL